MPKYTLYGTSTVFEVVGAIRSPATAAVTHVKLKINDGEIAEMAIHDFIESVLTGQFIPK